MFRPIHYIHENIKNRDLNYAEKYLSPPYIYSFCWPLLHHWEWPHLNLPGSD